MVTSFGRELRKLRIDRQELLKHMADKLKVSSAYLSAVENGNRKIPDGWMDKIIAIYDLNKDQAAQLRTSAEESADEVRIRFGQATQQQREAAIAFAKAFENLDDDQIKKIMTAVKPLGRKTRD